MLYPRRVLLEDGCISSCCRCSRPKTVTLEACIGVSSRWQANLLGPNIINHLPFFTPPSGGTKPISAVPQAWIWGFGNEWNTWPGQVSILACVRWSSNLNGDRALMRLCRWSTLPIHSRWWTSLYPDQSTTTRWTNSLLITSWRSNRYPHSHIQNMGNDIHL